jgi:tetratricopeptide (TPR) repeat protein
MALDSTSLEVRDLYDVIRRSLFQMRRAEGRSGRGRLADRSGAADSISLDMAVLDTAWVAAMSTLAQRIEERVRPNVIDGPNAVDRTTEGRLLMAQGRYAEAVQLLAPVVAASPGTAVAWDQLMRSYVALGEPMAAAEVVHRWSESGAEDAPSAARATRLRNAVVLEGRRGYWTWRRDVLLSEQAEGREISQTELAAAYAVLGDRDRAYELLLAALENSESRLLGVPNDPVWDPLRRDPRFRDIEERIQRARFDTSLRILSASPPD